MFVERIARALDGQQVPYAVVGGYAVALHGVVRGTVDLDIVLKLERSYFLKAETAFHELGLRPRLPVNAGQVFDFREEYIKHKNLIAWSFYNPHNPVEIVDVIITEDLKQMKIKRVLIGSTNVKIVSLEDLIRIKTKANRPQDTEDVKALRKLLK